jgi:hypothetical protein
MPKKWNEEEICGKKCAAKYPNEEKKVVEWFLQKRLVGCVMSFKVIKDKFQEELNVSKPPTFAKFKVSSGWFRKFLRRNNLVQRRIGTSGRELPKNCEKLTVDYLNEVNKLITHICVNLTV